MKPLTKLVLGNWALVAPALLFAMLNSGDRDPHQMTSALLLGMLLVFAVLLSLMWCVNAAADALFARRRRRNDEG